MQHHDVIVIGAGPAGTAAAVRAAELGADVAVIEAVRPGGVCTNTGCTPVRVLARTARLLRDARSAATYGVGLGEPTVDWAATMTQVRTVVERVHGVKREAERFAEAGVDLVHGRARFSDPHTVELLGGEERLSADHLVVAVGGHSRRLPFPGSDLAVLGEQVLDLAALPARIAIVGSGSTGVQLATIFAAFGSEVTILDVADRLVPTADLDVSRVLGEAFDASGIAVHTGIAGVGALAGIPGGRRLTWTGAGGAAGEVEVDEVLLCVGWPAAVEGLGLESAGLSVEGGRLAVDAYLRTDVPHILACGDVTGDAMLVQAAETEGAAAGANAVLGPQRAVRHGLLPWGGFTDPDIAGVGLTEAQARERDPGCIVATVRYEEVERPVIDDRAVGFCKLIVDRHREIVLGAHAAGEQAVEVVQAITTAMAAGATPAVLAAVEYAYPSYSAIIGEASRRVMRAT